MEAAFEYSKIQKKSAGSFVLRLNPEYNYIDAINMGEPSIFYDENYFNFYYNKILNTKVLFRTFRPFSAGGFQPL